MYYSSSSRSRGYRSSGSRPYDPNDNFRLKSRKGSRKTKLIFVLAVFLALQSLYLLVSYIRMSIAEADTLELTLSERKQQQELDILRPQAQKLRADIETLGKGGLPELTRLEFDKVLTMDQDYVKNVVFTVSGKGNDRVYEYKMVMHNGSLNLIHPQVDILFFDPQGIQVGMSRLGVQNDGVTPTLEVMERGEIRSFSSQIQLSDNAKPGYFRLRIWK